MVTYTTDVKHDKKKQMKQKKKQNTLGNFSYLSCSFL
jgi:hypothetical protein